LSLGSDPIRELGEIQRKRRNKENGCGNVRKKRMLILSGSVILLLTLFFPAFSVSGNNSQSGLA
jgi:hypothetical protein